MIVLAGVGVGAGVGKVWPTPTLVRSRWLYLVNDNCNQMIKHSLQKIVMHAATEEKERSNTYVRLEHFTEFGIPADKGYLQQL